MKKLLIALAVAGSVLSTASHAQTDDPKFQLATKVVGLQQGPELDRLVEQLTASTTQSLLQDWGPKLESVPKARQPEVRDQLNAELQKYANDVNKTIGGKAKLVGTNALVPAYMERFTVDELRQIAAFFESPAIQKYQAAAPELGNVFVQQLVEATRADVQARAKQFDDSAAKIVGVAPNSKPTPAPSSGTAKPPAKK
jgi:uncharacterized protein